MKKLVLRIALICLIVLCTGSVNRAFAQYDYETEAAPDSVSIDDEDPILYSEEDVTVNEKSNTALYIGIALVVVVAGALVYRGISKKKKE